MAAWLNGHGNSCFICKDVSPQCKKSVCLTGSVYLFPKPGSVGVFAIGDSPKDLGESMLCCCPLVSRTLPSTLESGTNLLQVIIELPQRSGFELSSVMSHSRNVEDPSMLRRPTPTCPVAASVVYMMLLA